MSKLPEWPDIAEIKSRYGRDSHVDCEALYETDLAAAALARMEALVEYVDHTEECAYQFGCTCGLSELLAACERSVAAQPSGAGRRKG